jgi:hypothetical protein
MSKKKYIETPERLWELFKSYELDAKSNPIIVEDYVGKDAELVRRKKEVPLTVDSFEDYLFELGIINDLGDYFSNKDERYTEYATICRAIKRKCRKDQINGGMAGIYNPSITQRLNGLTEKTETETTIKGISKITIE